VAFIESLVNLKFEFKGRYIPKSELSSECSLTSKLNVGYAASFERALTRMLIAFMVKYRERH